MGFLLVPIIIFNTFEIVYIYVYMNSNKVFLCFQTRNIPPFYLPFRVYFIYNINILYKS